MRRATLARCAASLHRVRVVGRDVPRLNDVKLHHETYAGGRAATNLPAPRAGCARVQAADAITSRPARVVHPPGPACVRRRLAARGAGRPPTARQPDAGQPGSALPCRDGDGPGAARAAAIGPLSGVRRRPAARSVCRRRSRDRKPPPRREAPGGGSVHDPDGGANDPRGRGGAGHPLRVCCPGCSGPDRTRHRAWVRVQAPRWRIGRFGCGCRPAAAYVRRREPASGSVWRQRGYALQPKNRPVGP